MPAASVPIVEPSDVQPEVPSVLNNDPEVILNDEHASKANPKIPSESFFVKEPSEVGPIAEESEMAIDP